MSLATGIIDTVLGNGERGDGPDGDPLNFMTDRLMVSAYMKALFT
ncbi:MAG: hypothetical protein Ct9H300mP22_7290 [Gammaproteobacteria bacterium]|nr:MAG: hypothetical protein Ct9H300mP22_7290 [Gammaproteobacteria bacterium]